MKELEGKVILITGSSRSIGAATAKIAKERGATVILHGKTDSSHLMSFSKELESEYTVCDVTNKEEVDETVSKLLIKHGKIDILVNSAGIVQPKPFLETEDNDWLEEYSVNVLGSVHFCQAVIPTMLENKSGNIVNIASIRGHQTMSSGRGMSYSTSKAAIMNLTASLAKEFAPHIIVNAVSPGFTETDMAKTWNETVWKQVETSLKGRAAKPEEIAEAILFLASDRASFITGQTLLVDGGYSISQK